MCSVRNVVGLRRGSGGVMRSRSCALRQSASPELEIIIRHGKAVLGVLSVEGVIAGVLRFLQILALTGPKVKEIIE